MLARHALICIRMLIGPTAQRLRRLRALAAAAALCMLLCIAAQAAATGEIDGTPIGARTLNCVVDEAVPNPPETAQPTGGPAPFTG